MAFVDLLEKKILPMCLLETSPIIRGVLGVKKCPEK